MAQQSEVPLVTITVNDIELQVPKGELIVESVKRLGLEIPIFCYHPRMKPVGMCRMCLVEVGMKQPDGSVRKMPKPQASCTLPASDGLVIYTDTEQVHKDRKGVLEFLLVNHPLDCPICDKGGECPLQNNTQFYGPSTSRFVEMKRHAEKAYSLSEHVKLDLERCIQCGRCVRFTEEISGDSELAFRFRGSSMQPATFELGTFTSKFSGNTIEICPVGALTSSHYRFRARPWDLETRPGICTVCSNGCSVWVDHRKGKMVRINGRTNEAVNEEWTCDRGKFGLDWLNSPNRLDLPLVRDGDRLVLSDWAGAYAQILPKFVEGGASVAGLAGPGLSNEDLYLFKKLFAENFQSANLDRRMQAVQGRKLPAPAISIESLESLPGVVVFGTSLADEEPILFLRLRKGATLNNVRVATITESKTEVDEFAEVSVRFGKGQELATAKSLLQAVLDAQQGSTEGEYGKAARMLLDTKAPILTTESVWNFPQAEAVVETLSQLANAVGSSLNVLTLGANGQGAEELGIRPDGFAQTGLTTRQILEACANGSVKALWLAGVDPISAFPDRDLATRALETVPFLVVQDTIETESTGYASVILPMTAPGESEASFTNVERRVQVFEEAVVPVGQAKPGWRIFSEARLRIKPETPKFSAKEVMEEIAYIYPAFAVVGWKAAIKGGVRLG